MLVEINGLNHQYKYFRKQEGIKNSIRDFFSRTYDYHHAVKNFNLTIAENQIIGLIGANGAGKTTILKILMGILKPISGEVNVLGFDPYQRKAKFKYQIAFLMGNKSQLMWDLPAIETFNLNRIIYNISPKEFRRKVNDLVDLFNLENKLYIPVRKLSLGERMKMEFIASIIHSPRIMALDEPTLGLDIITQYNFREYIRNYYQNNEITIIITSHNMDDVEQLCDRLIFIQAGEKIFDGNIPEFKNISRDWNEKKIVIELLNPPDETAQKKLLGYTKLNELIYSKVVKYDDFVQEYQESISRLGIKDLVIENDDLETTIRKIMTKGTI